MDHGPPPRVKRRKLFKPWNVNAKFHIKTERISLEQFFRIMRPSKVVTGSSGTHKRKAFNLAVQF